MVDILSLERAMSSLQLQQYHAAVHTMESVIAACWIDRGVTVRYPKMMNHGQRPIYVD